LWVRAGVGEEERRAMVKVLVGQRAGETFFGFWAEFEGEKVSSYEDPRLDKNIVFTLYKCTAYNSDVYRVHVADESNPFAPVYELRPFNGELGPGRGRPDYSEPWEKEDLAAEYPMFLKDIDYFDSRYVDPGPRRL
jgi:hypothetical protein